MKPGIYDITNDEYHASEGVSRSQLTLIKKSPYLYWYYYINPEKHKAKEKEAWIFGKLLNTLLIEPHKFDDYFIEAGNRKIITPKQLEMAKKMINESQEHPLIPSVLSGASFEQSIYWEDKESGLLIKARPDIWNHEINIVCDIKTSCKTNAEDFMRTVEEYDYHMQAAMQLDGIYEVTGKMPRMFACLVFPKSEPYFPFFAAFDNSVIEHGREVYKDALKYLKIRLEKNDWLEERTKLRPYMLPQYHINRNPFKEKLEMAHV